MSPPGERRTRWSALALAVLCLAAWLSTPWHLAVEVHDHDDALASSHAHADHEHDHDAPGPESHDPHDAADHLLPHGTRPVQAPAVDLGLARPWPSNRWETLERVPAWVPPRDDEVAPKTDPPASSRRPRAPPVG